MESEIGEEETYNTQTTGCLGASELVAATVDAILECGVGVRN
jgi:hypothetical protein